MRICMLVRNAMTRDARVAREASSLGAAGHRVTVLCLSASGLPTWEEREGYVVARLVSPGGLAGPTIRSESAAAPAPPRRRFRLEFAVRRRDRTLSRAFERAARRFDAEAFHAHDLNTLEPAARAAAARGARLVYDAHELYPEITGFSPRERKRWSALERELITKPDVVIAASGSRADEMSRRYGVARPLVVMNCPRSGPAPDPAASALAAARRPGRTLFVYAGGFTPNRALEHLVRAVREAGDGVALAMIGWGPLEGALRAAAGDRVEFLPPVAPDEVIPLIAGADAGVVSYLPVGRNNELAAPNKLFEYLHAGLAVVASDLPDIRQVVEAHDVGVLFDPADEGSIVRALREVASSEARRQAMRERARAAAPLYTWEAQERVLLEAYERLAS